jgi:prophage regulatory protein
LDVDKVLRLPQVLEQIGMGRAWVYAEIQKGKFPPGLKLGARARGWTASSIELWLADRIGAAGGGEEGAQ